jgi:hypothetical protein
VKSAPANSRIFDHIAKGTGTEVFDVLGPTVEFLTWNDEYCVMRGVVPPGVTVPLHSHDDAEDFFGAWLLAAPASGLGVYLKAHPPIPHHRRRFRCQHFVQENERTVLQYLPARSSSLSIDSSDLLAGRHHTCEFDAPFPAPFWPPRASALR